MSKPERAHNDAAATKSCRTHQPSLKITAKPTPWEREQIAAQGHDPIDTMHMVVDDAELQLLLVHQEGLYERGATEVARFGFRSAVDRQSPALREGTAPMRTTPETPPTRTPMVACTWIDPCRYRRKSRGRRHYPKKCIFDAVSETMFWFYG